MVMPWIFSTTQAASPRARVDDEVESNRAIENRGAGTTVDGPNHRVRVAGGVSARCGRSDESGAGRGGCLDRTAEVVGFVEDRVTDRIGDGRTGRAPGKTFARFADRLLRHTGEEAQPQLIFERAR